MRYSRLLFAPGIVLILAIQACSTTTVSPDKKPAAVTTAGSATKQAAKPAIDPVASNAYQRALRAITQGNEDQAVSLLTDMTGQYPNFSGPHANLGLLYLRQGDSIKAEAAFNAALRVNPNNAVANNHLGIIYRQQGRFSEAEQAYLNALQSKPDYANAHLNLAILYDIYLLKLDKALQHYQQFQSLQAAEDNTVKNWIIGLKRRIKVSK